MGLNGSWVFEPGRVDFLNSLEVDDPKNLQYAMPYGHQGFPADKLTEGPFDLAMLPLRSPMCGKKKKGAC